MWVWLGTFLPKYNHDFVVYPERKNRYWMATSTFHHTLKMFFMFVFSKTEKQCSIAEKSSGLDSRPMPLPIPAVPSGQSHMPSLSLWLPHLQKGLLMVFSFQKDQEGPSGNLWITCCASLCLVTQSCLTLCHGLKPTRLLCPWDSSDKNTEVLPCTPPGHLPSPGIKPRSPTLWEDSLLSEPLGKPKNTGVGSLSLLQGIFPTQESNWSLLHCRWILYQLSNQGSPLFF